MEIRIPVRVHVTPHNCGDIQIMRTLRDALFTLLAI
jgi:hypothetical protein